jgi:hypothetical protein
MALWKVKDNKPIALTETSLQQEKLLEDQLEEWIASAPEILGEPLFIVGRQVLVPDVKDRIDLLALDPQGNAVIIELKRGKLKDPVEIQALRYASYVAKWGYDEFEKLATAHHTPKNPNFLFNEAWENFCTQAGTEEVPDVNQDQRVILAGVGVKEKLGSVALWLRQHKVDITVVELKLYRESGLFLLQSQIIIPQPVSPGSTAGIRASEGRPWLDNGREWHLRQRCSPRTAEMLTKLQEIIEENSDVEASWAQKFYVRFDLEGSPWLSIETKPSMLVVSLRVRRGAFNQEDLAKRLGLQLFSEDLPLAEKFSLPSSVLVKTVAPTDDMIVLRLKPGFDIGSPAFRRFLEDARKNRSGEQVA